MSRPRMTTIPREQLSSDPSLVCSKCPNWQEYVQRFKITPFHLTVGLVLTGVTLENFELIRSEYLDENAPRCIHLFALIHPQSTVEDLKHFLLVFGVDEEKVKALPDSLSYVHLKSGRLAPFLTSSDFESFRNRLNVFRRVIIWDDDLAEESQSECRLTFKKITGRDAQFDKACMTMSACTTQPQK